VTPVKRPLFALLLAASFIVPVAACAPQTASNHSLTLVYTTQSVATSSLSDTRAIHQSVATVRRLRALALAKAAAAAAAKAKVAAAAKARAAAQARAQQLAQRSTVSHSTSHPAVVPSGSVRNMIIQIFGSDAPKALRVATCESGLNPNAVNRSSDAEGVFQFLLSTWRGTPYAGYSRFNAWANISAAHWVFLRDGYSWREWQCGNA